MGPGRRGEGKGVTGAGNSTTFIHYSSGKHVNTEGPPCANLRPGLDTKIHETGGDAEFSQRDTRGQGPKSC